MRVYVTLSEKELQISIKVPDSAGWDEFIQILRDRFKLHGSAKLIIATEDKPDFQIKRIDDIENNDELVLRTDSRLSSRAIKKSATSARPAEDIAPGLTSLQIQLLTCELKYVRIIINDLKTAELREHQIQCLRDFREHGQQGENCYKWHDQRLFYTTADGRNHHELTVVDSRAEMGVARTVQGKGNNWLLRHESKAKYRDLARLSAKRRDSVGDIKTSTLVHFVNEYKRKKQHPWDASEEYLINAIQLWQRNELTDAQTLEDDKLFQYMDKASTIVSEKPTEQWSETELREAKLRANVDYMCCRLKGKSLHIILLGAAASGKSFSQSVLLQQLLPEALEVPVTIEEVAVKPTPLPAKYKDFKDWTDHGFDKAYSKRTGLHNVAGDAYKLKTYLEHKFGKLGNISCDDAGVPFPTEGVLVQSGSVTYHVALTHLKYEDKAGAQQKIKKQKTKPKGTDYQHGLRIGNPVYFVTIDGEIAREIEGPKLGKDAKSAIHDFKKTLRHALQFLGFNTLEPSVHPDRLVSSLKRHAERNQAFVDKALGTVSPAGAPNALRRLGSFYPKCAFKAVLVYASLMHTKAAAASRALKLGKAPPLMDYVSWAKGVVTVEAALNLRQSRGYGFSRFTTTGIESDYFDDNVDFVIIDNQFGYMKRSGLYITLPKSVKVSVKFQVKGEANFDFEMENSKEKNFKTTNGLLGPCELVTCKQFFKEVWSYDFDGDAAPVTRKGFLHKTRCGKWTKRFFALRGTKLLYYKSIDHFTAGKSPQRTIELGQAPDDGCKVSSGMLPVNAKQKPVKGAAPFGISDLPPPAAHDSKYHSSYSLCAPTQADRDAWMEAISTAVRGGEDDTAPPLKTGDQVQHTVSGQRGTVSRVQEGGEHSSRPTFAVTWDDGSEQDGLEEEQLRQLTSDTNTDDRDSSARDFLSKLDKLGMELQMQTLPKIRNASRFTDLSKAPSWLQYGFGQFRLGGTGGAPDAPTGAPHGDFVTLHMEKLLRWEDAVDSLKLQVLRQARLDAAKAEAKRTRAESSVRPKPRSLRRQRASTNLSAPVPSGPPSPQTDMAAMMRAKMQERLRDGRCTQEEYDQIMGTIINANEMIKQERAAQDEADLPAYLLEEDRDLSQRPPVPPRQKLPSGPDRGLSPGDTVQSPEGRVGRLARLVDRMERTWHVDWRHGKASGPVPESDLTKTVAGDEDSSDDSAAPAYDPDDDDSSSDVESDVEGLGPPSMMMVRSQSEASDLEGLGPPPTPDENTLSKSKPPPPKPLHGTPPPLPRGGPLGAKALAHESDDELPPPPTPGKPTAKASNRADDDSTGGESDQDVDDVDVDDAIARLEAQKVAAAEAEDFAAAAALKKQIAALKAGGAPAAAAELTQSNGKGLPPPPPRDAEASSKGGAGAKKNPHPPPPAKRKHKKHDKSKAKAHPESDSDGDTDRAMQEEVGGSDAIAIGCYVVATKGSRNEQRGRVIGRAAGKKWNVQWDNDDGKPNPGTYRGINLQVVNAGADAVKTTVPKKMRKTKVKHKVGKFKPGATVKSIATTGKKKGMRGTLVKSIDKSLGTWEVKWANGKPGKPYPESKLKVIKDSE